MNKVSKSMKPDNSQKPTISCFVLKMADVKDKISYEGSIMNMKRFGKF